MKKQLTKGLGLLCVTLVLSACGGGGGSSTPEENTTQPPVTPTPEGKDIVVCSGTDQGFSEATVLAADKEVKGLANDPSIRLWDLSDGSKKACVLSGSVEVL